MDPVTGSVVAGVLGLVGALVTLVGQLRPRRRDRPQPPPVVVVLAVRARRSEDDGQQRPVRPEPHEDRGRGAHE
ncbi:hypothetical protein ACIPYS_34360 [Kitasatospora sp. NPDC089913]|uniref:hypothetical protein n=1 Tax=Streptomycetaceae TaxID=2062 RepID=UPI00087CB46B|nr:hypothetical protein [Streptomyces sp. TLI_053]SDT03534.1 hypothetical protein SAMN05216371_1145 [Streptomyces sp. TLI_053]